LVALQHSLVGALGEPAPVGQCGRTQEGGDHVLSDIEAAAEAIRAKIGTRRPKVAVVLGSGLGRLA